MATSKQSSLSRRRRRGLAILVAVGLLAASCGDDSDDASGTPDADAGDALDDPRWDNVVLAPEARDDEPVTGGSVEVALNTEEDNYDPRAWRGGDFNVAYSIFDPLALRDADGTVQPYLAESIEPNAAFDEWTVALPPDVTFHDGTPLNAEALRRGFDDHLKEGATSRQFGEFVESLEVDDELTVTYFLTEPYVDFPDVLTLPLGWPFSPDAAEELGDGFGDQPVGTGPFKVVSWERDNQMVLERNEAYWQDGLPYLDEITFRPITDETTRAQTLESGGVVAAQGVGVTPFAQTVAEIEGVRIVLGRTNNAQGMLFNTAVAPVDDVRVRQALAHAADQGPLLEVAADEAAALTEIRTQPFPEDSPFYSEAAADAWPSYDPDEAERLLEEYSNDPERSDGKDVGEPVELTITTGTRATSTELSEAFGGAYEAVGVDVTIEPAQDVFGVIIAGSYEAMLFRQGNDQSPLGEYQFYFGGPDEAGNRLITNFTGFHDDTVAGVIGELRTAEDLDRQVELAEEMGLHLAEQVPVSWLGGSLSFFATDESVDGLGSWVLPDGSLGSGVLRGQTMWSQVWLEG